MANENIYIIAISESEYQDIDEALKSKANTALNMYNESQYTHYMSLARSLSLKVFVQNIKTEKKVRKQQMKTHLAVDVTSVVVESKMNFEHDNEPTFKVNAFKTR